MRRWQVTPQECPSKPWWFIRYNGKTPFFNRRRIFKLLFSIVKCSFSWAYTGCEDGMMGLVFRKTKLIQRFQISHGIVEVGTFLANSPKTWTGNVGFILSNFL